MTSHYNQMQAVDNLHTTIHSVSATRDIMQPILNLPEYTTDSIQSKSGTQLSAKSFQRKYYFEFAFNELKYLTVPSPRAFQEFMKPFDTFALVQNAHQLTSCVLFINFVRPRAITACQQAVKQFVSLMSTQPNVRYFRLIKKTKCSVQNIIQKLITLSGNSLMHQLYIFRRNVNLSPNQEEEEKKMVVVDDKNNVLDLDKFIRVCIINLKNHCLFTTIPEIRNLRAQTNQDELQEMIRLNDRRHLIQQVWQRTVNHCVENFQREGTRTLFTNECIAQLFKANQSAIESSFDQYVLGEAALSFQPHCVRSLLDHLSDLINNSAFDLTQYNLTTHGVNWLLISIYIGKNFLQIDKAVTSDKGALCLSGTPGSGKSKVQKLVEKFFNGFQINDSTKGGINEFQNGSIAHASCICVDEVKLDRLSQPEWKVLADSEASMKCRVKNQPDVILGKFCPVLICTNDNVHEKVITKLCEDEGMLAVHRRWAFVRFFDKWNEAHNRVCNVNTGSIVLEYADVYHDSKMDYKLMNMVIGFAILWGDFQYAIPSYIVPYYAHCLVELSKTLMGQIFIMNMYDIKKQLDKLIYYECNSADQVVQVAIESTSQFLQELCTQRIRDLLKGQPYVYEIIEDINSPLYEKYIKLCRKTVLTQRLQEQSLTLLIQFLNNNQTNQIFQQLKSVIEADHLECFEENTNMYHDTYEYLFKKLTEMKEQEAEEGTQCIKDLCGSDIQMGSLR